MASQAVGSSADYLDQDGRAERQRLDRICASAPWSHEHPSQQLSPLAQAEREFFAVFHAAMARVPR